MVLQNWGSISYKYWTKYNKIYRIHKSFLKQLVRIIIAITNFLTHTGQRSKSVILQFHLIIKYEHHAIFCTTSGETKMYPAVFLRTTANV